MTLTINNTINTEITRATCSFGYNGFFVQEGFIMFKMGDIEYITSGKRNEDSIYLYFFNNIEWKGEWYDIDSSPILEKVVHVLFEHDKQEYEKALVEMEREMEEYEKKKEDFLKSLRIEVLSLNKEEQNEFANSSQCNNGGGYFQPLYTGMCTFNGEQMEFRFSNTSCGDFGSRYFGRVGNYSASYGSMLDEETEGIHREVIETLESAIYDFFNEKEREEWME